MESLSATEAGATDADNGDFLLLADLSKPDEPLYYCAVSKQQTDVLQGKLTYVYLILCAGTVTISMTGQRPNMSVNHSVLLQSSLMQRKHTADCHQHRGDEG